MIRWSLDTSARERWITAGARHGWTGRARLICLLVVATVFAPAVLATEAEELAALASRHFDQDFLSRSAEYHQYRLQLFLLQTILLLTFLFLLVRGPLGQWGRKAVEIVGGRLWLARALILGLIYVVLALLRLPFSIIRYHHALSYGLRHDTLLLYLTDWTKSFLITGSMVLVVGLLLLGLFAVFPRAWTVIATAVTGLLAVVLTVVAPLLIDPLYYQFRPLENKVLENQLVAMATCAGLVADKVLVANASRRSSSVNAYFTGIGATRRIVLYDTLVEKFSDEEVAMVFAHELGHWKGNHIRQGLSFGILGLFIGLLFADRLLRGLVDGRLNDIRSRGDPALAIPGYAIYVVLMFVALVPSNMISRQVEAEADWTALELTGDPQTFVEARVRISQSNLSHVLPSKWVEFLFFGHPSPARRIRMAENYSPLSSGLPESHCEEVPISPFPRIAS